MNETTTPRPALQRRATQRLDTEIELDVESDHNFYQGFSANLSDGGLFIATYRAHAVGDRLRVRFSLPGIDAPIEAKVEVKWIREAGGDGVPGVGAAFVELDETSHALIARFIEQREPLFYAE